MDIATTVITSSNTIYTLANDADLIVTKAAILVSTATTIFAVDGDSIVTVAGEVDSSATAIQLGTSQTLDGYNRVNIMDGGIVTGDYTIVFASFYATLNNAGSISGNTVAVNFNGLPDVESLLFNSGSIFGFSDAIMAGNLSVQDLTVENTGLISSQPGGIAIYISGLAKIFNSGTIIGGIQTGSKFDVITNAGTINGSIYLGQGDDTYDGRGGSLTGTVFGGDGADHYIISDATTQISEVFGDGSDDTVSSTISYHLGDALEILVLLDSASINGVGNSYNNILSGNSGDNRLIGSFGLDTIAGDFGNDRLFGGFDADRLTGDDGDDVLNGGAGNDVLYGGDGDDTVIGGAGKDQMLGDQGADVFVFASIAHSGALTTSADSILDFVKGDDLINLSAIDANTTNAAANDAFAYIGSATFSASAGQLRWMQTATATIVQLDVNGDTVADCTIRLVGLINLTAGDFIL